MTSVRRTHCCQRVYLPPGREASRGTDAECALHVLKSSMLRHAKRYDSDNYFYFIYIYKLYFILRWKEQPHILWDISALQISSFFLTFENSLPCPQYIQALFKPDWIKN